MKKVGIITFHRSHNCGSIMQAYAMQNMLRNRYNIKPEFIDFSTPGQQKLYSVINGEKNLKGIARNIGRLLIYRRLVANLKSYDRYIEKHLPLSNRKYSLNSELAAEEFSYDGYITGSDQVWNISIADYDPAYFLNFVGCEKLKVSYAASFGARRVTKNTNKPLAIKNLVEDIDHVSVREPNGKRWLAEDFGIESTVVLDPTLLLDSEDYLSIEEDVSEKNIEDDRYIFIYATSVSKQFEKKIRQLAKEESLKIVVWQPDTWLKLGGPLKGYILPRKQNPGKYLSLIKNARYVFTASFHGVIFCMQYRKSFWVMKNSGMNHKRDDRILSLMEGFGMTSRLIPDSYSKALSTPVDYDTFEKEIPIRRKVSLSFLDRALKDL